MHAPGTDALVGRRRELDTLRRRLDAAVAGAGCLVLCVGEPGIGKTRLAQELAGFALARGTAVAWGRGAETEGAPPFWPWRQVLRALGTDPTALLAGPAEAPADRFRVVDDVAAAVLAAARDGLVVVLDDVHGADEPSLLVLRHLADRVADARLLVLAAARDTGPAGALARIGPDLLRAPAAERLDLGGLDLAEVREQLARAAAPGEAAAVLAITGGNPLFVREVARAMADGTWRPDRPPGSVLDVVGARLGRLSADCRRWVQAAAVLGRDFSLGLAAAALGEPPARLLPLADEAIGHGLIDRIGEADEHRFVHALTRDAVEASLTSAERVALHRAVAAAVEERFAADLGDHLADLARHWAVLAPYGEAATARAWSARAGDEAMRRLAYEEAARLYRAALGFGAAAAAERCRLLIALGRACALAGDQRGRTAAAAAAADAAPDAELLAEAALVLEAAPDPAVHEVATRLCERALARLGPSGAAALRARLLAQRSHLAYYDGEQDRVEELSRAALVLARTSGDDRALVEALHAEKEARPGPAGRARRLALADEMAALATRTGSARTALWSALWRVEAFVEAGRLEAAAQELPALEVAAARVGGPAGAWHADRAAAWVAQAQGRFADARALGRRAVERMRPVEPAPATGAFFALGCALAGHVGVTDDVRPFVERAFAGPPRFRTMSRLSRAFLLLRAGHRDEAAVCHQQAGPRDAWELPPFFVLPAHVYAALVAAELGLGERLVALLEALEPFRGEHAVGEGGPYLGPVELTLGRGAAALGRLDRAVDDLTEATARAEGAGAPAFTAEARHHLAAALLVRDGPGDADRAAAAAREADRMVRALGMAAYAERSAALVARADRAGRAGGLSPREREVAGLVADGLTNRQIAARLVISERTAENHVQHILTKLGFATRSQIAAWRVRTGG